jgi:hypothetical protein
MSERSARIASLAAGIGEGFIGTWGTGYIRPGHHGVEIDPEAEIAQARAILSLLVDDILHGPFDAGDRVKAALEGACVLLDVAIGETRDEATEAFHLRKSQVQP